MKQYILALDQGTTSCRAVLFDKSGESKAISQKEITQIYPKPGWVEHDPMEIWGTQSGLCKELMEKSGIIPNQIVAIGITNQRETTVLWDRHTGRPIYNAIVWQSRQTSEICDEMKNKGLQSYVTENTGLVIDAYFSASKIKWILDHVVGAREKAERGDILFGTIDTWLLWNMTRGDVHATDYSNASRTMIYNIKHLCWDKNLLKEFGIPEIILPEVRSSSEIYGYTHPNLFGAEIPISGIAGDQQSALFGQACFEDGMAKSTYGTGAFILMNTGDKPIVSKKGLLTTIAWGINGKVTYALEGSVFAAGSCVQWLRDELQLIHDAHDSEYFATKVSDTAGIYVVPAFTGLGAPYWDMYARGAIVGITRGGNRNHIIRATLESIAYQVMDIIKIMEEESKILLQTLKVDGGAATNNFLMQFQSDILGVNVLRPNVTETTAMGAAFLAGLAVGFWKDTKEICDLWNVFKGFEPYMENNKRDDLYRGWKRAVKRSMKWEEPD